MDFLAVNFGHLAPGITGNAANGLPSLANDDLFLACALHVYRLLDPGAAIPQCFPVLGFHCRGIRQFFMETQKQLLTGDFSSKLAHRQIRCLILGVEPWPDRHLCAQIFHQIGDTIAIQRGDHKGLIKFADGIGFFRQFQKLVPGHQINFVQYQQSRLANCFQPFKDFNNRLGNAAFGINQQAHHIGILGAAPGGLDHGAVKPAPWIEDARRVDEYDLGLALHGNSPDQRPGGLHLVGDN